MSANFRWKGSSPPTIVGIRKLECFCYLTVKTASFVWIGYQRVTDGQTDRQTDGIAVGITALCIACNAAAL